MAKAKSHSYTVISSFGSRDTRVLKQKATLTQLQDWVGGYVQMIKLQPNQWAVVNEEGAIRGMPLNKAMTWKGGPLYGPVVLLPKGCHS
jgi:hypothetical protein